MVRPAALGIALPLAVSAGAVVSIVALAGRSQPTPSKAPTKQNTPLRPDGSSNVRPAGAAEPGPASKSPPRESAKRRKYRIAAVGDSLTTDKFVKWVWPNKLAELCPKSRVDNYGVGGNMVNQMRKRFVRDVFPKGGSNQYTHVIVFGGVNDLYSDLTAGRTPAKISADLLFMYDEARRRNAKVVAITVAPWGGFKRYFNRRRGKATHKLNGWIRDQFDAGTVAHAVDAFALLTCDDSEKLCKAYRPPMNDGLHFGPPAHLKLAKAIKSAAFADCR